MARSLHPALDAHLRRLPVRVCADWGLSLHARCGICGGSRTIPVQLLDPRHADRAIEDVAQAGQCSRCRWPYLVVYLSDDLRGPGCVGCGYEPWGLPVADRRDTDRTRNGPDGPVIPNEFAPKWRPPAGKGNTPCR